MPSNIPIYVTGGDNITEPPATIQVYSPAGTEETAYLQPGWDYAAGKRRLTYMVKRGWGEYLLKQFVGGRRYAAGYYHFDQSSVKVGRAYDTVTLTFSDNLAFQYPGNVSQSAPYQTTYTARSVRYEQSLESMTNYRTNWNYDLYGYSTSGSTPSVPAFWATATTTADATGIDAAGKYLWSKDIPAQPESGEWKLVKRRTKPGVEFRANFRPVVVETRYWSSRDKAMERLVDVGKQAPPDEYDDLAADWLITDVQMTETDGFFATTTEYTGSTAWDDDLYTEAD